MNFYLAFHGNDLNYVDDSRPAQQRDTIEFLLTEICVIEFFGPSRTFKAITSLFLHFEQHIQLAFGELFQIFLGSRGASVEIDGIQICWNEHLMYSESLEFRKTIVPISSTLKRKNPPL